ncbi:MAG: hypothetical protein ACE5G2_12510 [Candidatus Krumholzibacteriia bacterium]
MSRIARWLGLDYYSLQGRLDGRDEQANDGADVDAAFVELDVRSLGEGGCSIELTDGEGSKLVIRGVPSSDLDLPALAESFLGRER